ncbi:MAG TPA: hypothetical protein VHY31_25330 [Streptosporangiaceae bacterium]|nr:hypothetical protein [Streptosporangiaceae bacterium]
MRAPVDAARLLRESNPVADDAFAGAAGDSLGRATFERVTGLSPEPAPATGRSPRRRLPLRLAAVATGVVVVAGLLAVLLSGAPRLTRPVHTAWEPARPLPRGAAASVGGPAGAWRLASYLVSAGWRENTAGPEPGSLTCPTATTCYVEGDNATSDSGPADLDTMYVSYDGAVSWNTLPVPAGITFTSALSCGSAASCAAGALDHGQPVFVSTADGAHSWTIDPLPAGDGQILQLSCATATTCAGLVTATPPTPPRQYYTGVKFLATTDGGRRFAASAFPAGAFMQNVSCPTATECVALGVNNSDTPTRGVALTTRDAGAHWSPGTLPAGMTVDPFPPFTCVDASHCFMIGDVRSPNAYEWTAMAVTADSGRTWTERPFPASAPNPVMSGIACPTARTCYTSGEEAIPQRVGTGVNDDSPVVLITHDAGLAWNRVTFAIPAHVPPAMRADPNAFLSVGDIQCPQPDACIALGAASQGSNSTAVYAYRSRP